MATVGQFVDRQFFFADIGKDQGLNVFDIFDVGPILPDFHHFQKLAVQPFDQRNGFKINFSHQLIPLKQTCL